MNQRKSLKELNLLDKFLFDEAMDDPENVKTMLDIILLNTRGKHPELVSPELIELLVAGSVGSSFILMHGHIIRTVRYVYQDMSDRFSYSRG